MDSHDPLLLSLRTWPEGSPADTSAATLIRRIQLERSHFREINESLLEAEIAEEAAAAGATDADHNADTDETSNVGPDEDPVALMPRTKQEMDALLEFVFLWTTPRRARVAD